MASPDRWQWYLEGTYQVKSGKGSYAAPFVLSVKVTRGGSSSTALPRKAPAGSGDLLEVRVWRSDYTLSIDLSRGRLELRRPSADLTPYTCKTDSECVNTCASGVVNSTWLERNPGREPCQDGCAGQRIGSPRCLAGICAAHEYRGGVHLNCTASGAHNTKTFCEVLSKIFAGLLAGARKSCRTNRDCGAYPAGLADCGGVADESTALELRQVAKAFRARHCVLRVACAPRRARPAMCRQGRCVSPP